MSRRSSRLARKRQAKELDTQQPEVSTIEDMGRHSDNTDNSAGENVEHQQLFSIMSDLCDLWTMPHIIQKICSNLDFKVSSDF